MISMTRSSSPTDICCGSWWRATGVHEIYDGGRGALAFALGNVMTFFAERIVGRNMDLNFWWLLLIGAVGVMTIQAFRL